VHEQLDLHWQPLSGYSGVTSQLSPSARSGYRQHARIPCEAILLSRAYGLVFTTGFGRPVDGNNLRTRSIARLLDRAGLPPMRFHALRHAAATLLMAEGVPPG
jgi:integrase